MSSMAGCAEARIGGCRNIEKTAGRNSSRLEAFDVTDLGGSRRIV
jgi:hypothetical protein